MEYETKSRLHVHIYDTAQHQYQIDETIIPRPSRTLASTASGTESELDFQYNESPFEFWVTRKQDGQVLFDTRAKNIPTYDDAVEIQDEPSDWTVMPAHPLIFEDQYLQISNAVQVGANIYGLGEYIVSSLTSHQLSVVLSDLGRVRVGTDGIQVLPYRRFGPETLVIQSMRTCVGGLASIVND